MLNLFDTLDVKAQYRKGQIESYKSAYDRR